MEDQVADGRSDFRHLGLHCDREETGWYMDKEITWSRCHGLGAVNRVFFCVGEKHFFLEHMEGGRIKVRYINN